MMWYALRYISLLVFSLVFCGMIYPDDAEQDRSADAVDYSSMFQETLLMDIDTASYYELLTWCRELDLSDSGSRKELQSRILNYYSIDRPVSAKRIAQRLEVQSAKESEYFTIEEVDENYIVLQGDVVLRVEDTESGTTHTIEAQKILFNQALNIITAEGDIEYTLIQKQGSESFKADSFTFDIDTWKGVFYAGEITKQRKVGGKTLDFVFVGDSIERLQNDTIIMHSGKLTSSNIDDPHYHIKAQKIWILAPGEWALSNAVLYLGRIPILYLPFFFYPGDEFFFHPSLGYRNREGSYLNTTVFLIGEKEQAESPFSFLQITEGDSGEYTKEVKGLFLRKVKGEPDPEQGENRFLKVMADLYSRLGAFAGLSARFPPDFTLKGGIGISRSIFLDSTGNYTPFYPESGSPQSYWNSTTIRGIPFPFPLRFGIEANLRMRESLFSFSGNIEYYSDPFFSLDFYNRQEDIDWGNLMGLGGGGSTQVSEKRNLTWEARGSINPSRLIRSDLIQKLSVPSLNLKLFWQSRDSKGALRRLVSYDR